MVLCTCWPICCHFLRRRISANRPYFLHDTPNCFGIVVNSFTAFQPLPHPPVTVGMKAFCLLLSDRFGKISILFRTVHPLYKAVIAASGHCKESTHNKHRILLTVAVDDCVILPLLSLPSCGSQKIPQQLIFHAQPLNLVSLLCNNVPWRSSFSRPPFGLYRDPGFSLPLFGTFPFHKAFLRHTYPENQNTPLLLSAFFPIQA